MSDATNVIVVPGIGPSPASGSAQVPFGEMEQRYFVNASGDGFASKSILVTVDPDTVDPVISEFLANPGKDSLKDKDGSTEDWIELRNPYPFELPIGGYFLSDDLGLSVIWMIPEGTSIPASGQLLIFASGKNRAVAGEELHTQFKLDSSGDSIFLVGKDGSTVVDSFTWINSADHPSGKSYGRFGDPSLQGTFVTPTPETPNSLPFFTPQKVTFNDDSRSFTDSLTVSLSTPDPALNIHYTTDRSEPDSDSPIYSGPLDLTSSTMLRARLFDSSGSTIIGDVSARNYLKLSTTGIPSGWEAGAATLPEFTSNLPIIVIDNMGGSSFNTTAPRAAIMTIHEPVNGVASLINPPNESTRAGIRIRGASSSNFAKKQYRLELWNQEDGDKDSSLLGLPSDSDFILGAPFVDKSFIRNTLTYELGRELGLDAPRTRHVEVFINENGGPLDYAADYRGVYFLAETNKISKDRVDLEKLSAQDSTEPEITGGYLLKWEGGAKDPAKVLPPSNGMNWNGLELVEPDPADEATAEQRQWISDYVRDVDNRIAGPDFADPVLGYAPVLDIPSYANLFVINELTRDQDAYMRSSYFYKDRGGKLKMGPLWDYNLTMGTGCCRNNRNTTDTGSDSGWQYIENDGVNEGHWEVELVEDPDFWQAVVDRWQHVRKGPLGDSALHARIDGQSSPLSQPAVRNFKKWNNLGSTNFTFFFSPASSTWEGQIDFVKTWTSERMAWIDSQMTAPPIVSPQGGFVSAGTNATIDGSAGTIYYTTDGSDPRLAGGSINPQARSYAVGGTPPSVLLSTTTTVTARSLIGQDWSGPATQLYVIGDAAGPHNLVISEIHYNPAEPSTNEMNAGFLDKDDFEFLELQNVSTVTIDLSGVSFTLGLQFTFPTNFELSPGERTLIVRNQAAVLMRYPALTASDIAGEFQGSTGLGNKNDHLILSAANGSTIRDFQYQDSAPWPTAPDGSGVSLVLIKPGTLPDHADPFNWRSGITLNGSPNATDATSFSGGDFLAYASGGSDPAIMRLPDGTLSLQVPLNLLADDVTGIVETSLDLINWTNGDALFLRESRSETLGGNGVLFLKSLSPQAGGSLFVRYRYLR
ncbi:MAG: CotH kinase family protein [Verrucomicrobiaceae bacterium]